MIKEKQDFIEKIKILPYNFNHNNIYDYKDFILLLSSMLNNNEDDDEILEAIYNVINMLAKSIQLEKTKIVEDDKLIKNTFSQRLLKNFL